MVSATTRARESCRTASTPAGWRIVSTSASVRDVILDEDRAFIERMDMFFLASADEGGQPQCSYKGGDPGFIRVLDERTLAFPNYDGNGMYLSLGNVLVNAQIGMLLIDFVSERPSRMRIEGTASIAEHDELAWEYPGAQFVVRRARAAPVSELPALHPPHGARRALAVRAAQRPHAAGARVEARPARRGRAAAGRPRRRSARDIALPVVASVSPIAEPVPTAPPQIRRPPQPLHGGPLALYRFMRDHGMLSWPYAKLIARWLWLKARFRGRLQTDGLCFVCPDVTIEIGRDATLHLGRWSWIGHGSKIRVHEGEASIGAKSVLGQECTISAFQHVSIGRECIIADRVMLIDFDHGVVEVERPIREQGIYKRDVRVGHNVWIGYGVAILRGVTVGDNSVLGTSTIVSKDVPANAVAAGVPVRVIRMRKAPQVMRWE